MQLFSSTRGELHPVRIQRKVKRDSAIVVMDYQVDSLTKFMTAVQSADAIVRVLAIGSRLERATA